ncbi:27 kDa hemolymph protein-like [Drosophila bipectinata]|uniref:27 kDa hemolymph protein-like n=1 Tax=Drosophila bipectinata TaxID=42026 RepID=UPI001C89C199|nr:27 kDa hemolymph protein-like [Drosophila bipectinata]
MHKYTMMGLCLMAALGAVLLEVNASPAGVAIPSKLDPSQLGGLSAQFLPPEYRNTNVSVDDIKRLYREKCKKVTGTDNSTFYEDIERAATKMSTCISGVANLTAIQEEMEQAKPQGELDTVFHKYCTKAPEAEACVKEFNTKMQVCLTAEEKRHQETIARIGASLLGFACTKGGDQIALFVAEQGPECLEANKEAIANCLNQSFHNYIPKDGQVPDLMSAPELLFSPTHCVDLERFEHCVLHHLERCSEITPANIVQSIFKFVKNETDCQAYMNARANEKPILMAAAGNSTGGGATGLTAYSGSLLAGLFAGFLILNRY